MKGRLKYLFFLMQIFSVMLCDTYKSLLVHGVKYDVPISTVSALICITGVLLRSCLQQMFIYLAFNCLFCSVLFCRANSHPDTSSKPGRDSGRERRPALSGVPRWLPGPEVLLVLWPAASAFQLPWRLL